MGPKQAQSDHFVQFYESDGFLVTSIARFVLDGLAREGSVIVIATAAHRDGVAAHLKSVAVNVDALIACGRYVVVDAFEMLARITMNGRPDRELFDRHIGVLVGGMAASGRRISAFGEMVAVLWADGKTECALELEAHWNALCARHVVTLLCAYPMRGFSSDSAATSFEHVCSAHGRVLPTEDYLAPHLSDEGRLRAISAWQQKAAALESEVAERKRAEETLRVREADLRAFLDSTSLALHSVNAEGIIVWANQAELDLLGYAASEYIGQPLGRFHADEAVVDDILARLSRGDRLVNYEARLRCKDGSIKIVVIDSSVLWRDGRFVHTQCFTRDVTAQREAERTSRHLAAIVQSSDDAIFSKNLDGIITSWNAAAERIFGYTADEIVGRSITLLIPPDRLHEEATILSKLRRGERIDHFETVRRRKDGALLDVSVTISPVKDSTGKITGASKIARNITERKQAERALDAARAELARKNEELESRVQERTASLREAVAQMEEFSYTVSHDLRAPLRGMLVYSQALLEDYRSALDAQAQHCLKRIADNASRLDRMVIDVLTFSRISRDELKLTRVALDSLVRDLVSHYPAMQSPRAQIEIAKLHDVFGHEPSVTQIVSNLLGNAVKFVPAGVTPRVQVSSELRGDRVRLWVRDNGIGIKPDRQGRLFRMFERVHPDLPYEGTGVGLAIVRKAALRMGGDVGVESDGANGTSFWVDLAASAPST